jgi:hypothetical protein
VVRAAGAAEGCRCSRYGSWLTDVVVTSRRIGMSPASCASPRVSLTSGQPRLANLGLAMTLKRCLRSGLRCMPDGTVEIITGKERRRRWSVEESKRGLLAAYRAACKCVISRCHNEARQVSINE